LSDVSVCNSQGHRQPIVLSVLYFSDSGTVAACVRGELVCYSEIAVKYSWCVYPNAEGKLSKSLKQYGRLLHHRTSKASLVQAVLLVPTAFAVVCIANG